MTGKAIYDLEKDYSRL